jgi:Xaa-Pro aminopeptidase
MTNRRRAAKPAKSTPAGTSAQRLAALRAVLKKRGLDGFVVPRSDEHQGEYVPPCAERLAWLTGFTGSAGLAIVLAARAAVFVDGRYTLQVAAQVDTSLYELRHVTNEPPEQWLAVALKRGARLGIDPWLHTPVAVERLEAVCRKAGAELVRTENAVDAAWTDRPAPPTAPVVPHDVAFAGRDSASKRAEIADALKGDRVDAVVLTLPESIAWLLNIRGGDVAHSPLPLSFAILYADARVALFLDPAKSSPGLEAHLGAAVSLEAPNRFGPALDALGRAKARVQADPMTAADWAFQRLAAAGAEIVRAADPCLLPKACKNAVELAGTREAHRRDGAALTRFLAWLMRTAPAGKLTEIAAADRLEAFRRESNMFRDLSFDTISGAGPNGAIVHYRVTEDSNRRLEPGELYLVDSGAQYPDGTTDVTRTVAIGTPPAEAREHFTRVLKGHIALASVRFPKGTTGPQLDALARRPLWEAGLDYDHGTGHGVGSYLGVHEGPQSISKRQNTVALRPGMIVSNEPGYYRTGAYGIRIENLVVVQPADGRGGDMLGFETLTLAPIDRALIEPGLMSAEEIDWLDAYHARVREALMPLVDAETASWLAKATRPIAAA